MILSSFGPLRDLGMIFVPMRPEMTRILGLLEFPVRSRMNYYSKACLTLFPCLITKNNA